MDKKLNLSYSSYYLANILMRVKSTYSILNKKNYVNSIPRKEYFPIGAYTEFNTHPFFLLLLFFL